MKLLQAAIAVAALAAPVSAQAEWPERPVTIIVPAGAGGGTDATGRIIAEMLSERFGEPFNVVNQGEAGGFLGISNMTNAEPDGYTLGVLYNYAGYGLLGIGQIDHTMFTPIAQYNFDPAGLTVRSDSELNSASDIVEALKQDPASLTITCGGSCGNSFDTALAQLLLDEGVDVSQVSFIPTQGAAAGLQDVISGGVDVSPSSLPEARSLVEAGEVKPIAVFGGSRNPLFPDVSTVEEQTGRLIDGGAWRSIVAPAGLPEEISTQLQAAMAEIYADEEFQSRLSGLGFGLHYRSQSELLEFMKAHEQSLESVLSALGMIAN